MDKVADKALELLRELAEKMGTTVEKLYPYFVRQAYLVAVTTMIGWLLVSALIVTGGIWTARYCGRRRQLSPQEDWVCGVVSGLVIAGVGAIIAVAVVCCNLPILLNPEYAAIRDIIRAASGQ